VSFASIFRSDNGPMAITLGVNILLAAAASICLVLAAYIGYHYHWINDREFTGALAKYLYSLGPPLAAAMLIAAFKLPARLKIAVTLTIWSVVVAAYCVESVAGIWLNLPSVQRNHIRRQLADAAFARGVEFDTRTKSQVVEQLRQRGVDAVPSVFPQGLLKDNGDGTARSAVTIDGEEFLPLAGISKKLTIVCNEGGQFLTYVSDEHGFHNPPGMWGKAPVDVIVVGDSFGQGWCVPSDQNFVAAIRHHYPSTLSLAIEDSGPLEMLATLREYGPVLRPRVILWCFFEGNDLGNLIRGTQSPMLLRYLHGGFTQNLHGRQPEIDQALTVHVDEFRESGWLRSRQRELAVLLGDPQYLWLRFNQTIRLSVLRSRLGLIGGNDAASASSGDRRQRMAPFFDLLKAILIQARNAAREWEGELYFVYLPSRERYETMAPGFHPTDRDTVLGAAKSIDLPIIDVHPAFMTERDPLELFPFRVGYHYDREGHALVGRTIIRYLADQDSVRPVNGR